MGPLVWGLGTSWTMPGLASEGRAHKKRNIWEEGREGGKVSFGGARRISSRKPTANAADHEEI